jgi:cobalt/nickel transport system permease protein
MHLPDGFLSPPLWGSLDILSGSLLIVGLNKVAREVEERTIPLMGVLSAFVFAAQMINLPIAGGTSAHFLGSALVGILLGPWAGLTVVAVVLVVQCFLFQDGGVAALGANVFDMGVIGSSAAYLLYAALNGPNKRGNAVFWAGFWSALITVLGCSLSCSTMLVVSKVVTWKMALSVIGGAHSVIGLLEGVVTGTILQALSRSRPDLLDRPKV